MKCPTCSAWSEVLETRNTPNGASTKRRRECANGHRFRTEEVLPGAVDRRAVTRAWQAMLGRAAVWVRDRAILADTRPAREVAVTHGITDTRVRQIWARRVK